MVQAITGAGANCVKRLSAFFLLILQSLGIVRRRQFLGQKKILRIWLHRNLREAFVFIRKCFSYFSCGGCLAVLDSTHKNCWD